MIAPLCLPLSSTSKFIVLSTPYKHLFTPTAGSLHLQGMVFPFPPIVNAPYPSHFRLVILSTGKDSCQCRPSQPLYYVSLMAFCVFSSICLTAVYFYIYVYDGSFSDCFLQETVNPPQENHVCFLFISGFLMPNTAPNTQNKSLLNVFMN